MDLRQLLARELSTRRALDRRYSLRRFAAALGVHHATLHRIVVHGSRCRSNTIARIGELLGLPPGEVARLAVEERALALRAIIGRHDFTARTRWIAIRTGLTMDDVNIALRQLLHVGLLRMRSANSWTSEGT